jgi:hypothetical protein
VVDTFIDEVAVTRALQGDPEVWASLTPVERQEAVLRAAQKRRAEQAENAEWTPLVRMVGRKAKQYKGEPRFLPHPTRSPQWLVDVAAAAGYTDTKSLMRQARRLEKAREA